MKRKIKSVSDQHQDWLAQIDTEGPFLALPVVMDVWPQGVDRLGDADDRMITFKQATVQWQRALDEYTESARSEEAKEHYGRVNRAWIELVLDRLAGWQDLRVAEPDARLADVEITSPGGEIAVRPSGALEGRDKDLGALLLVSAPTSDLRATGLDGWAATEIDRMAMLLRKAGVEVGIVTDGQWWAIVWAKDGKPTGSGVVNSLTWAEEPLLRDAFLTLIDQRRFRAKDSEQRLPHLFERSELEAEVITEALGTQVRKSVELLVQAFSEARLAASASGAQDPLAEKPDDVYQAAVTILMRVVFLLFAEERDMLPTEQLYWSSYAISDILDDLRERAADGEEYLDDTYDAWHRLLAVSEALHGGVNYDEMRMPAYGGSLLDPKRFPWLHVTDARGLRLKVSDRVMLHVFDSVQSVVVKNQRRRISFRDVDVEQIGYIYEGLLGYTCRVVEDDIVLGLVGNDGEEPEIPLGVLQGLYDDSVSTLAFATALLAWTTENQPAARPKSVNVIGKLVDKELTKDSEAELTRLLTPVAGHDQELLTQLVDWGHLLRRDLRGIPYVVPLGGLVVVETPSRKNAGAHYTPRSLAEEVVKHALDPLVYEPGPLQTTDENAWRLKSSTAILDLRVADIAVGSGAFLVAAARFLADRLTESWTDEGLLGLEEQEHPRTATTRAIREIIARCLYGADINSMAVEMCKLSLWLVSMDKSKPFSFVDDKIFCGNSLLGVTKVSQLQALHLYPDSVAVRDLSHELMDTGAQIAEAIRLRKELASTLDEHDPMRSTRGKSALLQRLMEVTSGLSKIADGIIGTALPLGGKRGPKLDEAYREFRWELARAHSETTANDSMALQAHIDRGLTPSVHTDYVRWNPLHWVLAAPDVVVERGGFDAIVGNPAFLHSKKISTAYGVSYRTFLQSALADGVKGDADLAAYFLLRQASLVRAHSSIGLVITKSVQQSSTRKVGLEQVTASGARATISDSFDWGSGDAAVSVVKLWLFFSVSDSKRQSEEPLLPQSKKPVNAYVGTYPNGDGFRISADMGSSWTERNPHLSMYLKPYVRASDLSTGLPALPTEWIIDLHGRDEAEAKEAGPLWLHLREAQFPWRQRPTVKPRLRDKWWWFEAAGEALYTSLSTRERCITIPRTSNLLMPRFAPANSLFDIGVVVFATDDYRVWGQVASSVHYHWTLSYAATTRDDPSYAPKRVSDTFPWMLNAGQQTLATANFESLLESACAQAGGLRPVLNQFNSEATVKPYIAELRESFVELDREVMQWFGWSDLTPRYGIRTRNNLTRFTFDRDTRTAVLDRLLALNHDRARSPRLQHAGTNRYDD